NLNGRSPQVDPAVHGPGRFHRITNQYGVGRIGGREHINMRAVDENAGDRSIEVQNRVVRIEPGSSRIPDRCDPILKEKRRQDVIAEVEMSVNQAGKEVKSDRKSVV